MPKFVILQGNVVSNIIVCDEPLDENWIEVADDAAIDIGDIYQGDDFTPKPIDMQAFVTQNRVVRNGLLAQSDWTQLPDVELTPEKKAEFAAYRQALRALDLESPIWPAMPAEKDIEETPAEPE